MGEPSETSVTGLLRRLDRCARLMRVYRETQAEWDGPTAAALYGECFALTEALVAAGLYTWGAGSVDELRKIAGLDLAVAGECVALGESDDPDESLRQIAARADLEQPDIRPIDVDGVV